MQVPLNEPSKYVSAGLVFVTAGRFLEPRRAVGSATVHDDGVVHGVAPLQQGVRYALFLLRTPRGQLKEEKVCFE